MTGTWATSESAVCGGVPEPIPRGYLSMAIQITACLFWDKGSGNFIPSYQQSIFSKVPPGEGTLLQRCPRTILSRKMQVQTWTVNLTDTVKKKDLTRATTSFILGACWIYFVIVHKQFILPEDNNHLEYLTDLV